MLWCIRTIRCTDILENSRFPIDFRTDILVSSSRSFGAVYLDQRVRSTITMSSRKFDDGSEPNGAEGRLMVCQGAAAALPKRVEGKAPFDRAPQTTAREGTKRA